jgi:hypothetical protein
MWHVLSSAVLEEGAAVFKSNLHTIEELHQDTSAVMVSCSEELQQDISAVAVSGTEELQQGISAVAVHGSEETAAAAVRNFRRRRQMVLDADAETTGKVFM